MNKHTPGPWFLGESERGRHFRAVDAKEHGALASVVWLMEDDDIDGVSSPRCEANAHLIAAAPDLLDALEEVVQWLELGDHEGKMYDKCKSAIARARGEA